MNELEEEIIKKINYNKLTSNGFQKENNKYYLTKYILNNKFKIVITITNNSLMGKIYDLSTEEEYTNYLVKELNGKFVESIREEYQLVLEDIKNKCREIKYFKSNQANRISDLINDLYHDKPSFLWQDEPHGVFRNKENKKWYALIMEVTKDKITMGKELVNIINLKLPPEKILELLEKEGYYQAYHMNKKYWLTIILDDTIKDEEIISLIKISYNLINN